MTPPPGVTLELSTAEGQAAAAAALQMDLGDLILGAQIQAAFEAPAVRPLALPWPVVIAGPPPRRGTLPTAQRTNPAPQQADEDDASPPGGSS